MDIQSVLGLLVLTWFGIGFIILYGIWMAGWKYFVPFFLLKLFGISFIYCIYLYFSNEALEDNYIYIRPLRNYILAYTIVSISIASLFVFEFGL